MPPIAGTAAARKTMRSSCKFRRSPYCDYRIGSARRLKRFTATGPAKRSVPGDPELRFVVDARRARRHAVRSRVRARPLHLPHSFAGPVSADIWTAAILFQVVSGRPIAPETDEVSCGDRNFSGIDSTICVIQK